MDWLTSRFELTRNNCALPLRPMEGLRGYAVMLVFLVHYVTLSAPWIARPSPLAALADALHTIGNTGVDLFFVLSGYLIYGSLISRRQHFLPFIRRRIARIYPAFSVVFGLYLGLSAAFPDKSRIPAAPLEGALCVAQNYLLLSGFGQRAPIVTVSWSLSYEMAFYFAIPLLIAAFGLHGRSPRWRSRFFAGVLLVAAACCVFFSAPVRVIMFIAGILLHEAMAGKLSQAQAPATATVLLALLLGMGGMLAQAPPLLKFGGLFMAFFLLCLACFRHPSGRVGLACGLTPMRWLGNMSYSYYLLHGLALKLAFAVLAMLLPPAPLPGGASWVFFLGWLAPMFAWTLLPSAALFLFVERPYSLVRPVPVSRQPNGRTSNCS
jgi:peptidoglycan/LPS O-acetylase OafA/YrhL